MPDETLLERSTRELHERIAEIAPLVEEHAELSAAAEALARANGNGSAPTKPARKPVAAKTGTATATKPKAATKPAGTGKRGRPPGSGNRAGEVLGLLAISPGLKVAGIAEKLGIKPNYLYRVMPGLEADGKVTKAEDGGYTVVAGATE